MLKKIKEIDIVLTVFNQEEIIEKVLFGIFYNTTTPFNLILVFDGCTDKSKERALKYIKNNKPNLLLNLIHKDTPNLFELRANNFGFKLCKSEYIITLQDDMYITDYGWERRITYPLRLFDDVLAVTGRAAQDIKSIGVDGEKYINTVARELNNLPRNVFAVRDVINRGPIAFNNKHLKSLNYLNDDYAPGALDDAEISLRAWIEKKLKVGSFYINYISKQQWSKVNSSDSTMKAWDSWSRNKIRIHDDFMEYLNSGDKHTFDYIIDISNIDYVNTQNDFLNKIFKFSKYPLRLDKRTLKKDIMIIRRECATIIKTPFLTILAQIFGDKFLENSNNFGFKKALIMLFK